jgi:flavin reductase (DIM6/NTAB) family NADH-FMN oxidoreductase RutF
VKRSTWSEFSAYCGRPQRICWAVAEHGGRRSICPLGWKMTTSFSPPMMAISVAPPRFTHDLIADSGEVVLAWPGEDLAEATLLAGTTSGRDGDKFAACGLTAMPGTQVRAPRVKEALANLECKVRGRLTTGDHTIFACEIVEVWLNETPRRLVCQVGSEGGFEVLAEKGRYRMGVVRQ